MDRHCWQAGSTNRSVTISSLLIVPPDVEEIRIAKILLGKDIVRIKGQSHTKFFNRMCPITLYRIGMTQIIMRPGFLWGFLNSIRP